MNDKKIALIIIFLCFFSIAAGIFSPAKQPVKINVENSEETTSFKKLFSASGDKIAMITLEGAISAEQPTGFMSDLYSSAGVLKALKKAGEDNSVKGVLLRINSPGGTVAMSQEIYNSVLRLRKEKPVVVSMADVAASGGYYIAAAADRIFADPGTLTGSIGVIFNSIDAQELLTEKLGIRANIVKSGKFKDIGSPYRGLSDEERTLLQNIINSSYQQFLDAITRGRIERKDKYKTSKTLLTSNTLKKYADGRIFTGEQAIQYGFVDKLGGLYESHLAASDMAIEKFVLAKAELPLVEYNKPSGINEILFGISESFSPDQKLQSVLPLSYKFPRQPLYAWE
jgi:protease-4